jgi:uncharacterized tellurite resistance protein B-like protein
LEGQIEGFMDKKLALFQNLVNLAASDCRFTDEELDFLSERAERWGIGFTEFEAAIGEVSGGQIHIALPESKPGRVQLMQEMIRMMAADGELAEIEKRLCATASAKMDFSNSEFSEILDSVLKQ